ncbi:MKI67 FHA domain-interacting nucleolar phosphoprotein [Micropterus salmoides]|uniref:MKI67 FHA domain-interacting nucleolar phosphoprotein-like n=1 Tax=Micropterus salmoides TaxID=27706 RepID=UPI0018EAA3AF|nr:MKI67 FHA domain-interacting nucleolar phosphoprotein-like [Micropterus salmoides]XP_038575571.1 MKI67 FHA domain-interacting nucleolar phosphoprotein [Micropterus salmoides]
MTESKAETAPKPAKELLALNPKQESEFKKKVQEAKKNKSSKGSHLTPGVIYVGHLPLGLFEPQLKTYFGQFGKVLRLRLSRSKKTGGSKGYAFVEFECDEVAKIVAETMNNYLMGERLIKCNVMPPEKVHEKLFVGSEREFKKPSHPAVARYNKKHTEEQITKLKDKLLRKESKLRKRLAARGIDYDFPGFAAQVPQKKKLSDSMNASTCSDDTTPVCTPSLLERRKSMVIDDDDADDEIVIKMPAVEKEEECSSSEEEDSDNEEEDDDDDSKSEEPSEEDAEAE